ncbi:hypothetical protein [Streptomyces sp. MMG1121]|uniref:hypothetical protein n=1 Tax=Streptomyces sp. MMG1121 TaxID=1415544 RepID=UPI0006AED648|nr:hypothetical protein [Streptomyces sp. MMG1121]KOV57095.1 hypothetical protein ADK64_39280 [Streptomyces sp. MMG1121]
MDITNHLAVIDLLCDREFPAEHGRTDDGTGGPGYLIAELQTSGDFYDDGGSEREETEAQYEADRDALGERLAERWGPADAFSLSSAFERTMTEEDIDEPWATLASHVPDVHLWKAPTGRWVALGVSQWDDELPFQLLAVVTTVDPP